MESSDPNLVPDGWDREVDLGDGLAMLHYPASERMIGGWYFRHPCVTGDDRPCVIAGRLHPGHQVPSEDPLTITPSVLCTGCGTHGFVREGVWVPA